MKDVILSIVFVFSCTMIYAQMPVANAGNDTLFCGSTGQLNAISENGGYWSTEYSEYLNFSDINDPQAEIYSTIYSEMPQIPFFEVVWTEISEPYFDQDTVKIVFSRIPSNEIEIIPPKCFGEIATLRAVQDSLPYYSWNFNGGIVDNSSINNSNGVYQNLVYWTDEEYIHLVSLVSTNYHGCLSTVNIDTIYEPMIPIFDVQIFDDTCLLNKGAIIFGDTLGSSVFFWIDTTVGPDVGTPITTLYNLPAGEYDVQVSYLTPNTIYYAYYIQTFGTANCIDTMSYEIEPTLLIDASASIYMDIQLDNLFAPASVIFVNSTEEYDFDYNCTWEFGDGVSETNCDPMLEHIYNDPGCYIPYLVVEVTNLTACRDTAYIEPCINIQEDGSAGLYNMESDYLIYPNPVREYFNIETSQNQFLQITIIDALGNEVMYIADYQNDIISVHSLNSGLYSLVITTEKGIVCKKLIVLGE
ncbi:MAG: T9SS type A sorting domain-containing protein [Bacteroidales bacterium]|nr:T9SS type A sorting domain-containing protein [Bacteroidales bacterium]